jgi:hypothetical protein
MAAAGNVYPDCCNDEMLLLADDLLTEEFNELMDEELSYLETEGLNINEVKETLDLIYVAAQKLNTLIGADKALECWNALQENNMSKCIDGKLVKRDDGKVMKPEGYTKLDLSTIL